MRRYLLFILLFNTFLFSQPFRHKHDDITNFSKLEPTIIVIPTIDSTLTVFYLYHIPYDQLIFEKDGNSFVASERILVEIQKDGDLVTRDFEDRKIVVDDFTLTQSRSASLEGYMKFDLETEEYTVKGTISDLNSAKDISLLQKKIDGTKGFKKEIFNPIVVDFLNGNCSGNNSPLVVNQNGSIPFGPQNYQLIIPIADTTVGNITVKIKNNDQELSEEIINESYISSITLGNCDHSIFLQKDNQLEQTRNFVLKNFSYKLKEGIAQVTVIIDSVRKREFPIEVTWFDKPFSLRNPEIAIEMLKYVEKDEVISKLLDADEEKYPEELLQYWKQFDPTPQTEYNELMDEYYSRIDYATKEFSDISRKPGASTDRGKIYIKYGKPDKIERSSNSLGYVVETWIYNELNQKFLFVDKQGTGNFILVEG